MSFYFTKGVTRNKGITYILPHNTQVATNFSIPIAKKYDFNKHRDTIYELSNKLEIMFRDNYWVTFGGDLNESFEHPATHVFVFLDLPFRYAQVLSISYRKHLTRIIRRIMKYNLTNINYLADYITCRVQKDFERYFGRYLEP